MSNKCISLKRGSKEVISRLIDSNAQTQAQKLEQANSDYMVSLDSVASRKLKKNVAATGSNHANQRVSAALVESWN